MKNTQNEARIIFKQIKKRMASLEYKINEELYQDEAFYVNNRYLTKPELEKMSKKIKAILSSEESVQNPLIQIIPDKEEYYSMDSEARTRYILELSKIYSKLRKKIEK